MTKYRFDYLVFIGRFQPFHCGHVAIVRAALAQAQQVIILCGSADMPRTLRNPWSTTEREVMIRSVFNNVDNARIIVCPVIDVPYDDGVWVKNIHNTVASVVGKNNITEAKIGVIGHVKDVSSYYLNLFPDWGLVRVDNYRGLNATTIRQQYFRLKDDEVFSSEYLPAAVLTWLQAFRTTEAYQNVRAEQYWLDDYKRLWANAPYAPIFVTTDAIVVHSKHILLVERKNLPGQGLWALPGGFVNVDERLLDGCLRELMEETNLGVTKEKLINALHRQKVYDAPNRSVRGRTITHAFYFKLKTDNTLPFITASDDAVNAFWQPLEKLERQYFFEDHYDIIHDIVL